jgi:hypothetical protein
MVRVFFSLLAAILAALSSVEAATNSTQVTSLGQISYPNAAFTYINRGALHIAAFKPFGTDTVGEVKNIGEILNRVRISDIKPDVVTSSITWPNEILYAPNDAVKGFDDVLIVSGGFLVPGKGNGAVTLIDRKTGQQNKLTSTTDMFYHQVHWIDVDGDGLLDMITAGANKPMFGATKSALYWLKQPTSNPMGQPWKQTTIMENGPDVFFSIEDVDGDGKLDLLAPQFFTSKIVLYRDLNWLNPTAGFKAQIIDDTIGSVFSGYTADLNGDGKKEIIATNHIGDKNGGGVFVYELPSFKKHTIASGIVNILPGPGEAAPGGTVVVKPNKKACLPSIVVSGDGAGKAYLLTPKDTAFNYEVSVFLDAGNKTIGFLSAGDVDGDGKAEIFVPEYESGLIHVFRFK